MFIQGAMFIVFAKNSRGFVYFRFIQRGMISVHLSTAQSKRAIDVTMLSHNFPLDLRQKQKIYVRSKITKKKKMFPTSQGQEKKHELSSSDKKLLKNYQKCMAAILQFLNSNIYQQTHVLSLTPNIFEFKPTI